MTNDKIDQLLQNPFYLHGALLKVMPKTNEKETYELQKTLLQMNYANLLLMQKNYELIQRLTEGE